MKEPQLDITDSKNPILSFLNKAAPSMVIAITLASIFWVGNNTTEANVKLAVITTELTNLKAQINDRTSDRYTGTQAAADKTYLISEIGHAKSDILELRSQNASILNRILELERKVK